MQTPGQSFSVDPATLPAPQTGVSTNNNSVTIARPAGVLPQVPDGFEVGVFAEGVGRARWFEVAPNGDVLLARVDTGEIQLLRDTDGDGDADLTTTLASGFTQPQGMAIQPDGLYVADVNHVWRVPYSVGALQAGGPATAITPAGALGGSTGHSLRSLTFSQDGQSFFVGVGSESNLAVESAPRATILQFDRTGATHAVYASGLRNPAGLAVEPGTGALYATVVERDGMGDQLVPDFLTRVQPGGFYGWPYAYIGPNAQPDLGSQRPDLVARTVTPDTLFQAHSTPIGFTFYNGAQFPADYAGDAFVALRGSWNASEPQGFMLARVPVENGVTANRYEAFMTGFWAQGTTTAQVYGRPTTVDVTPQGTLLVGDDIGGTIYSVRYAPRGNAGDNLLTGAGGNDSLFGLEGSDTITGGLGADTLHGGLGNDLIQGGRGFDLLLGGQGDDRLDGGMGNDTAQGGLGADTLHGGVGDDLLQGGQDNDLLQGGQGNDILRGGMGSDWLQGGLGDDTLEGGDGDDVLYGNGGADLFVFTTPSGADSIGGFSAAEGDRLLVSAGIAHAVEDTALGARLTFASGGSVLVVGTASADLTAAIVAV